MDPLDVDPSQMDADADGFSRISAVADQVGSYVRNGLGHLGEFWGSDDLGRDFGETLTPGVQGLLGMFSGISDGMRATSGSVSTSAGLYRKSNDINTELAR